jgi:hypothetical protein
MYFTVLKSAKYRMFYYIIITLSCFDLWVIPVKQSSHRYPYEIWTFRKDGPTMAVDQYSQWRLSLHTELSIPKRGR